MKERFSHSSELGYYRYDMFFPVNSHLEEDWWLCLCHLEEYWWYSQGLVMSLEFLKVDEPGDDHKGN